MVNMAQNEQLVKEVKYNLETNITTVLGMDGMPEAKKHRIIEGLKATAQESIDGAGSSSASGIQLDSVNRSTYPVYHQVDGGLRNIPVAQLRQHLSEVDPATGRLVFDLDPPDPNSIPRMPEFKCFLNAANPFHMENGLSGQGLPPCRKANLPSEYARIQHMMGKHEKEWEMLRLMYPRIDKLTVGAAAVHATGTLDEVEIERQVAARMAYIDEEIDRKVHERVEAIFDRDGRPTVRPAWASSFPRPPWARWATDHRHDRRAHRGRPSRPCSRTAPAPSAGWSSRRTRTARSARMRR